MFYKMIIKSINSIKTIDFLSKIKIPKKNVQMKKFWWKIGKKIDIYLIVKIMKDYNF